MGFSEMGITQTDEYQETYDRFMEEYDTGKPIQDICADMISEMTEEFGADNGILHGVYYALAKCQWMCGGIHEDILEMVSRIIESGADLAFYQELGADDRDLKLRKRNLEKFYQSLQVPRATVRRRKKPESAYVPAPRPVFPPMPQVSPGDLISYPAGDQMRLFLILDINRSRKQGKTAYCFVWEEKFSQLPEPALLMKGRGIPFGRVPSDAVPEDFQVVSKLTLPQNVHSLIGYAYPMWKDYVGGMATRESFHKAFPRQFCLTLDTVVAKVTNIQNGVR